MDRLKAGVTLAALGACALCATPASATGEDSASSTAKGTVGGVLLGAEAVLLTEAALGVKPWWAYAIGGSAGAIGGGVGGYFLEQSIDPKASMFLLAAGMALVIPTTVATLSATAYEPPVTHLHDDDPLDDLEGDADPPPAIEDQVAPEAPPVATPAPAPPAGSAAPAAPSNDAAPSSDAAPSNDAAPPGTAPANAGEPATEPQPATEPEPPASEPNADPQPATEPRPSGQRRPEQAEPRSELAALPGLLDYRVGYLTLRVPAVSVQNVFSAHELQQYGMHQETELNVRVVNFVF